MFGGLLNSGATIAVLAAVGLVASGVSAQAADLGGNCCADLEERIAELEATTVRKGNRKVKLEISGQVNEALLIWDDGVESNAYVVGNDTARSRFRFKGSAQINEDLKAGYLIELGVRSNRSDRVDQNISSAAEEIDIRHTVWNLESKTLGRLSLGQSNTSAEGITEINLGGQNDAAKYSDPEDYIAGFQLRLSNGGGLSNDLEWRRLLKDDGIQPGEGSRINNVRYETPTFGGFTASASWGEDDYWDVGLTYKGEFNDFKIAGGIAYGETTDNSGGGGFTCVSNVDLPGTDADCDQVGGSLSVKHETSGIFVSVAGGYFQDNNINQLAAFAGTGADDESTFWAVTAGVDAKLNPLGKTTFYGEYFDYDGGANNNRDIAGDAINTLTGFGSSRIFDSGIEVYGGGVVQHIDAAAMSVYVSYRHVEGDLTVIEAGSGTTADVELEDLDVVMTGAIIKF